ncbi:MAG TPA: hypothetical protein VMU40_10730 [Steroidobacteraceae bacterium]|nr:hypothetical protein [Steroidobacteraceae bacterium]
MTDSDSTACTDQDAVAVRRRGFTLALVTNFAGKGISTIVQLAALPIAISALGQEKYGLYAMLAALLNWMAIASVTITPGLTIQLIGARARSDRRDEGKAIGTGLLFSSLLAVLLFGAVQVAFHLIGLARMFGHVPTPVAPDLWRSLNLFSFFVLMNLVLSVAEGAQAGYQKQYLHNLFLTLGNVVTIVAVLTLVRAKPSIFNMIVAVYSGQLLARALSFVQVLWSRPYLFSGMRGLDLSSIALMVRTGSAFLLTSIASFCYQSLTVYLVGRWGGPLFATQMSVFITVLGALGSTLMMFTQSLWPAVRDATVRADFTWVSTAYLRTTKFLMIYVALAAVTATVAGDRIIHLWVHTQLTVEGASRLFLGAYFLLLAWEQINYSFLIGIGCFWYAAGWYFLGSVMMLVNSSWLLGRYGISGMLAAMCLGPLCFTAWTYPLRLRWLFSTRLHPSVRAT